VRGLRSIAAVRGLHSIATVRGGAFRQKPFIAAVRGVRSIATARGGAFRQKPFRQVSGTFLRAGATPCTRNGGWWLPCVLCSCLGCDQ
jgi:hypothetical protein